MITPSSVGIIGLNPLSLAFAETLTKSGYQVIAFDADKSAVELSREKIKIASYFEDFTEAIPSKRIVWSFLEDGKAIDELLENYASYFAVGDIIIDLSNSTSEASITRMRTAQMFQIDLLDAVLESKGDHFQCWIGGNRFAFNYCEPMLKNIFEERIHYCGLCGNARRKFLEQALQK